MTGLLIAFIVIVLTIGVVATVLICDLEAKLNRSRKLADYFVALLNRTIDDYSKLRRDHNRLQGKLNTAKSALTDLVNQNHGDPQYDTWARKRAADALELVK
jgi:hypothetical protein